VLEESAWSESLKRVLEEEAWQFDEGRIRRSSPTH